MATVDSNVIDGSRLRESPQGAEKILVYRVYDLTGDESAREVEAIEAVPALGTSWAPKPTLRVESREVLAIGDDHAEVRVVYRTPSFERTPQVGEAPQVEIGSTLETVRTDRDNAGTLITVDYDGSASGWNEIRESIKEVSLQIPTFWVRYTRRETISPSSLSAMAIEYNGHVNSATFAGQDARKWLALINGRSDDGGLTHVVSYTFYFERNTWDSVVKATDPESGQIPPDVTEGNGQTTSTIYPEANFNSLNL